MSAWRGVAEVLRERAVAALADPHRLRKEWVEYNQFRGKLGLPRLSLAEFTRTMERFAQPAVDPDSVVD